MKRALWLIALILAMSLPAMGQTTSVTLNVTDAGSQSWNNGSYVATLTGASGTFPTFYLAGTKMTQAQLVVSGSLNGSGSATFNLSQNGSITPVGNYWSISVCPQASPAACNISSNTVSGTSQTISLTPPAITVSISSPLTTPTAYADAEVTGGVLGSVYYNLTNTVQRICTAVTSGTCSTWANNGTGGSMVYPSGSGFAIVSGGAAWGTTLLDPLVVGHGGTGATTLTGPIKGNGTSALSAAAAADIYGLWSGSCSGTTFLRGDGACATPSGTGNTTSTSGTSGFYSKFNGANSIINGTCDSGITTANVFTCSDTAGAGFVKVTLSGSGAGAEVMTAGTAQGHATTSTVTIEAPATATAYEMQFPTAACSGAFTLTNTSNVVSTACTTLNGAGAGIVTGPTSSTNLDLAEFTGTTGAIADASILVSNLVRKDTTNAAAAAMTLDLSAATGATAFKVPVIAGATAGANGVIDYDSTNNNTHIRTNAADSIAAAEAAAITAGFVPKSTDSTHGLITASLLDDGATTANTLTYTGSAGIVATKHVSNGTTAGFIDFPQGSTSSGVAPCNVATSICEQAPAAVTSYVLTKPAAAPTNNFSSKTTTTAGLESFNKMQQSVVLTGSAYTNATTGFTNVASTTNLNFSIDASTAYSGTCYLVYSASAVTAGPKIQFTGPASPTAVLYSTMFQLTATPTYADSAAATAFSTSQTGGSAVTASTNLAVRINFGISNGTNAGTLQLQAAANGSGTVTIQPGSYCTLQ